MWLQKGFEGVSEVDPGDFHQSEENNYKQLQTVRVHHRFHFWHYYLPTHNYNIINQQQINYCIPLFISYQKCTFHYKDLVKLRVLCAAQGSHYPKFF